MFVLGGTNDHVELIVQLKKLAYHVVLIDYFKEPPAAPWANVHEMVSTRNINAIEEIIQHYQPSHIFSACVDSSLYALAECLTKFGYHTLFTKTQYDIISNKHHMKRWMEEHKFLSARFQLINKQTNLLDLNFNLPLVVKPTSGNSSKGVSLINNKEAWHEALNRVDEHAKDSPILVEEFIEGTELSVDLVFIEGQAHIIMISEIIKKSIFSSTITKNIFCRETEENWKKEIQLLANALGNKLQLNNSLMLLQCIVNDTGISIVEFSLRIGGGSKHHLIKKVKNIDMIAVYIHMMLQQIDIVRELINRTDCHFKYAAIEYLYPENSGFLRTLTIPSTTLPATVFNYKNLNDQLSSTENSSNRIAGILVWGNESNEVNENINAIKQDIHYTVTNV